MRYIFKRLSGREWFDTINTCRARGLTFLKLENSEDLYDCKLSGNFYNAYYYSTTSSCRLIYFEYEGNRYHKRLREISFSEPEIDPISCVLTFRKIAGKFNENIPYEPHKYYSNGIYTYYNKAYSGNVTVLDMNSAYLFALKQPLADWKSKQEASFEDVVNGIYDYYSFENDLHCEMFYKKDYWNMLAAKNWAGVKIYGYKSKLYYQKTADELYRLKCEVNKERYKNVANIAVGCMHKRSGKQNNTTIAASIYAWFAWYINNLVAKFEKKGYNVIMITTDSIKIQGDYKEEDNIIEIGNGLGQFKYEYVGPAKYYSEGHYQEARIKWKGKPKYMIDGYPKCTFINNIEEELPIYETYAITRKKEKKS